MDRTSMAEEKNDLTVPLLAATAASASASSLIPSRARQSIALDLPALNVLRGQRVILASASPRRRALLAQIGLTEIETIPSSFAEDLDKNGSALDYALQTATEKGLAVYQAEVDNVEKGEPALVIAADTIVVSPKGDVLEKPKSFKHHVDMLRMLRDCGLHTVVTAVVCLAPKANAEAPGYRMESHVEVTTVKFDPDGIVTDQLILSYVKTREGIDKAGGYGIQGIGAILVESIDGSFDNVVGLPLRCLLQLIEKIMEPESELGSDR